MVKTKIAVLVSGGAPTFKRLDAQQSGLLTDGEIVLVIASNAKAYALTRAAQAGVPCVVCDRKELGGQAAFETAISRALADHEVELIVLAGFMSILSEDFYQPLAPADPQRPPLSDPLLLREGILWAEGSRGRPGLWG